MSETSVMIPMDLPTGMGVLNRTSILLEKFDWSVRGGIAPSLGANASRSQACSHARKDINPG